MRKSKQALIILLAAALLSLTACSSFSASKQEAQTTDTAQGTDAGDGNSEQGMAGQDPSAMPAATEDEKMPVDAEFSMEQSYSDLKRQIDILGLKEYKTIKTKKYTDKVSKNKRFLVLFLKISNRSEEKDYFNVNNFSAKVDGKDITNTVLWNNPEDYPTIFANIEGRSDYKGFVAWKVPKDWKKLELTYTGWKDEDALTLHSTLTKKDLKDPEGYS